MQWLGRFYVILFQFSGIDRKNASCIYKALLMVFSFLRLYVALAASIQLGISIKENDIGGVTSSIFCVVVFFQPVLREVCLVYSQQKCMFIFGLINKVRRLLQIVRSQKRGSKNQTRLLNRWLQ